jgi:DDE superfamily endonuclease
MCFLSLTYEGKASDKTIAELAGYTLPPGSCLDQDKGFQGFCLAGVILFQPKKKPRGGELTQPEKETNHRISSIRIRIEHAIGGVKRYRIVKDKIRLLKDGIRDAVMETCCGLHNFRLQYRPWHYAS